MVTQKQLDNLIPAKKGDVRNPRGNHTGTKHLSTHIQKLMSDDKFEANLLDAKKGYIEYKGAPATAIISVAITKAVNGDDKAREWLAKYGWGSKTEIEHTGQINTGISDPVMAAEFAEFLKNKTKE